MLRKFVLAAWQRRLLAGLIEDHPQFAGWSPRVACKLWHSRAAAALSRQQKVLMLRMLAGSVMTPAKLAEWGYMVDSSCPRCGQEDTVEHRLLESPAGDELREPMRDLDPALRTQARCILAAPALPPFVGHLGEYRMLAGEFVRGEPFFLAKFGPVCVDGSVVVFY